MGMLGLDKPLPAHKLPATLKAGTKLASWRERTESAGPRPLFRHCTIKKIAEVCEFQLDPKRMAQQPAGTSPGEELKKALEGLDPIPPAIAELLGTQSKLGGQIGIRGCSALVKPENEEVLKAIRQHPNLKGYIEPGAPPGYLIIKPTSDPLQLHRPLPHAGIHGDDPLNLGRGDDKTRETRHAPAAESEGRQGQAGEFSDARRAQEGPRVERGRLAGIAALPA